MFDGPAIAGTPVERDILPKSRPGRPQLLGGVLCLALSLLWTIAFAIFCTAQFPISAQTTFASITGTVTDSSGAAVPMAKIIVTNVETNIPFETTTSDSGNYNAPQLKEGTYTVHVKASGFREFVASNVVLASRDVRRVDAVLEVGTIETAVEVTAGATLIETDTARISDLKDANLMKSLPLNTRGLWAFLALAPNVLQAGTGSTIRFASSRSNQSNWAIDGITMADGVDNTQIGPLANYIESFQEVKIDIANNTAEFGTIGQVTIISKSGTNELHGNVFDYYSSPWFRARNPFALQRPAGVNHNPGGSVGGPVYLPKIYDGRIVRSSFSPLRLGAEVPSAITSIRRYRLPPGVQAISPPACLPGR